MKKYFVLALAALAFVGCNKNTTPAEPVNYTAKYIVLAYQSGANISKTVYTETTTVKAVEEFYLSVGSDWLFNYRCVYDRTFDNYGNFSSVKRSYYSESGLLQNVEEMKMENIYSGSALSECYTYNKDNETGEWEEAQYIKYDYDSYAGVLGSSTFYDFDEVEEEYVPSVKKTYSYYNGIISESDSYVYIDSKWVESTVDTYIYDQYSRLYQIKTEDKRQPGESTVTTYYY